MVQVTFVPTLMVSVVGLKAKLPLLSVVIMIAEPLTVGDALVDVAVGVFPVAAVGVVPELEVVPPPHAISMIIMLSASRPSHTV